jgi:type I restriction enzyme S subunit
MEVVKKQKSYSLSRDVETLESTGYKYIHYGDIHTKKASLIEDEQVLPNIKQGDYIPLQKGDLVIADVSEDYQGIGTPAILLKNPEQKIIAGLHTIALRVNEHHSPIYLYYLLSSPAFKKYGYKVGTGMKVFGISYSNLMNFESQYPAKKEQERIGNLFKQLDDTIKFQQKLIDHQQQFKKAMVQKMFPKKGERVPKIRIKGFNGEWEEKRLADVLTERKILQQASDEYPLVSFTVEEGVTAKTDRYDRSFLVRDESKKYKLTLLDDIVYNPANLKFGAISRNTFGSAVFSPIYVTFKVNDGYLPYFIELSVTLDAFLQDVLRYQEGTVYERMAVKPEEFLSMTVLVPSFAEQIKICAFFKQLDDMIALHQKKLENYQQLKKALLQRMFV